jgi:hypothetical protein
MAVLIEKQALIDDDEDNPDTWTVTAAVLPSGKILASEEYDASLIRHYVDYFGPDGQDVGEEELFENIISIYKTPLHGDFLLVEDPQEARKMIQEAGLK